MLKGIASAITESRKGPTQIHITTIHAADKDTITIEKAESLPLHPDHPEAISHALESLATATKAALTFNRRQYPRKQTHTPVLFGADIRFRDTQLAKAIITLTKDPHSNFVAQCAPGAIELMLRDQTGTEFGEGFSTALNFVPRGFLHPTPQPLDNIADYIDRAKERNIEIKTAIEARDIDRLKTEIDKIVAAQLRHESKDFRFRLAKPPAEELYDLEIYNLGAILPELRRYHADQLIKGANLTHHLAVKYVQDPKNPPFSDVVATYLADELDRLERGRITPTLAIANV